MSQVSDVQDFSNRIAAAVGVPVQAVGAVLALGADGATVPFIARYRKEATGGMDEVQVRQILKLDEDIRDLEKRRAAIVESLVERNLLSDELRELVMSAETRARLEDIYLPYRPKRRTRATMAVERGLKPLADRIMAQPATGSPEREAVAFIDSEKGVPDVEAALAGARDIVAEAISDNADVRAHGRKVMLDTGRVVSAVLPKVKAAGLPTQYEQYYAFAQGVAGIPSHRFLAIRRGAAEDVLKMSLEVDGDAIFARILRLSGHRPGTPFAAQMDEACADAWKRLIFPALENEVFTLLGEHCEREASEVFARNLKDVLMAAPYGPKAVVGLDPGIRTGCKLASVAATGAFGESAVIYPDRHPDEAAAQLVRLVRKAGASAVAVGNGTWGREAEAFARAALAAAGLKNVIVVAVSESGASVYSASDVAREEFPDLDLTIRGAISIARRLQDPLAELVKVDPRSIGVGQYQHDVAQTLLEQRLNEVVEDCVNSVGVDLNTASGPLLARVAGIGPAIAKAIVAYRQDNGQFQDRRQLLKVARLGPKAFQQCAGFLRISGGRNPLDASAVHPERYDIVSAMARDAGLTVDRLIGNAEAIGKIRLLNYVSGVPGAVDAVGLPTLNDIVSELKRPGRDPRDVFEPPAFRDDVREIGDLKPGMELEGIVTNVAAFGAFVDIGVHQDGLVHVSELSERYVKDPSEVVKTGMKVKVRVLAVEIARHRISLSMKGF